MKRQLILLFTAAILALCASARQPARGYRGFLEWSNDIKQEYPTGWPRQTYWYTGLSTSHGMQFNPWLFVGAGIEYEYNKKGQQHICAPFIQGRTDLKFGKFTPFGDLRLGYELTSAGRLFFSPNIGYRFNWGRKVGINAGLGFTLITYRSDVWEYTMEPNGYITAYKTDRKMNWHQILFSFRIGFDF